MFEDLVSENWELLHELHDGIGFNLAYRTCSILCIQNIVYKNEKQIDNHNTQVLLYL